MNSRWKMALAACAGISAACGGLPSAEPSVPMVPEAPAAEAPGAPDSSCKGVTCASECESGSNDACHTIVRAYAFGYDGVTPNRDEADRFAALGCDRGDYASCVLQGVVNFERPSSFPKDSPRALRAYERACEIFSRGGVDDSAEACVDAARMYRDGDGAAADGKKAADLARRVVRGWTSECGKSKHLCIELARLYEEGLGVPEDATKAAELYREGVTAVERNCRDSKWGWPSCKVAGDIYLKGVPGVPSMPSRAAALYDVGCTGHKYDDGDHLFSAESCTALGEMHEAGTGVERDASKAAALYLQACTSKNPVHEACDALTRLQAAGNAGAPSGSGTARSQSAVSPSAPTPSASDPPYLVGSPQRNAYALVVAVERYRDLPAATGARIDAHRFAGIAKRTLGVPEDRVRLAVDDRATRGDIESHVAWLKTNVKSQDRVYFFFSGHGAPNPSTGAPYLVPYDGNPQSIDATALRLDTLMQQLSSLGAKEVVSFVDTCFSGAGGRSVLPPGTRPLVRVAEARANPSVLLFTAASGAQISGEAKGGGGLFSFYVVEAVGKGLADIDGNGQLSMGEIVQWVSPRVERAAKVDNREQSPKLVVGSRVQGADDVIIAWGLEAR